MKVPLSLLLCFPVLSLSIALPPYETLGYYSAVYPLVTVNLFTYDRETSPIGVKALFPRVSGGECKAEVPEYFEQEVAARLGYFNELSLKVGQPDPGDGFEPSSSSGTGLKKRNWILAALSKTPFYRPKEYVTRLYNGVVALYHYDTARGARDPQRPGYPPGQKLFQRRLNKPGEVIFDIDTKNQFSRRLLLTPLSNNPALANRFTGPRELSSEHLVEVAPTFEFVKKVMGDESGKKLGITLDIQWLIIENIKYSIDSGAGKAKAEYFDPMSHLRRAVGSGAFPDELVIMTKELNAAKAPLIQGREAITDKIWEKFGDNPGAKFEAAARIATVAEAVLSKPARARTKVQMKRLTQTVDTWDQLYAEWHCKYEADNTIWVSLKKSLEANLVKEKQSQAALKTAHKADYAAKKKADPDYPADTKKWPDINVKLPATPPAPSNTDTFEKHWVEYQNNIYKNFKTQAKTQLDHAKKKMQEEYKPDGTFMCDPNEDPATKTCKEQYLQALLGVTLPEGWDNAHVIEPDDFKFKKATITIDPSC